MKHVKEGVLGCLVQGGGALRGGNSLHTYRIHCFFYLVEFPHCWSSLISTPEHGMHVWPSGLSLCTCQYVRVLVKIVSRCTWISVYSMTCINICGQ